jgi:hypothetical protein
MDFVQEAGQKSTSGWSINPTIIFVTVRKRLRIAHKKCRMRIAATRGLDLGLGEISSRMGFENLRREKDVSLECVGIDGIALTSLRGACQKLFVPWFD